MGDRVDKRYLSAIGMTGAAIAVVVIATADSLAQSMVFAVIFGFLWGMRGPLVNSMRGDYFGRTSFREDRRDFVPDNYAAFDGGADLRRVHGGRRGDYTMAFIILGGASALGSTFFLLTRPPSRRRACAAIRHDGMPTAAAFLASGVTEELSTPKAGGLLEPVQNPLSPDGLSAPSCLCGRSSSLLYPRQGRGARGLATRG